jgi:hypothetical protein
MNFDCLMYEVGGFCCFQLDCSAICFLILLHAFDYFLLGVLSAPGMVSDLI